MNSTNRKAGANFSSMIGVSVPTAQLDPFLLTIGVDCMISMPLQNMPVPIPKNERLKQVFCWAQK
jgi:hypothetical protein